MKRSVVPVFLIALCFMITSTGCSPKETPSASLWADGAWVLYQQTTVNSDNEKHSGTLKISSVGKETIEDQTYYWIEMREDRTDGVKITKFLATENPAYSPEKSFRFWDRIKRIIIQEDSRTPEEIPEQHLKRFIPTFVEGSNSKRFGNVKDIDPVSLKELPDLNLTINNKPLTAKGHKLDRHFSSSVNLGFLNLEDTTQSTTTYYINPDIPFGGLAKVDFSSTTTSINKMKPDQTPKPPVKFRNSLVCTAFGSSGATSQIIGTPVEKKLMPFPFLQPGKSGKK